MRPATSNLPVECFSREDGSRFIFHMLKKTSPTEDDKRGASELSELVGGHVLALTQATSLMFKKHWSVKKYLDMHSRHPQRIRDTRSIEWLHAGYSEDIKTVFLMSFKSISDRASVILQVLSLLAPDLIPEHIFVLENQIDPPALLNFCFDEFEYVLGPFVLLVQPYDTHLTHYRVSDIIDELIGLALVNRDSETNKLSIHRLVQSEVRIQTGNDLQVAFNNVSFLLSESFPKQVHGRTFEPRYEECAGLIQHLYALRDHLRDGPYAGGKLQPTHNFCRVMCNAAYYLVEKGATKELQQTIEVAMDAFQRTELNRQDPLAYAHLCNSAALEREMSGDFLAAQELLNTAMDIRTRELPPGHEAIWGVNVNLGNLCISRGQYNDALRFHNICRETANTEFVGNVTATLGNLARAYTALGRFDEAEETLNELKRIRGPDNLTFR